MHEVTVEKQKLWFFFFLTFEVIFKHRVSALKKNISDESGPVLYFTNHKTVSHAAD